MTTGFLSLTARPLQTVRRNPVDSEDLPWDTTVTDNDFSSIRDRAQAREMEEEIICNRHRDLADAVMNAVPTRRREGNRRRAQLTEDDGKAIKRPTVGSVSMSCGYRP